MSLLIVPLLYPDLAELLNFSHPFQNSRVGRGAPLGAGLRPPPKLHTRICRMQLSRRLNETRDFGAFLKLPTSAYQK